MNYKSRSNSMHQNTLGNIDTLSQKPRRSARRAQEPSTGKSELKKAIANAQAYTNDINNNMSIFDQRLFELEKKMSTIERRRSGSTNQKNQSFKMTQMNQLTPGSVDKSKIQTITKLNNQSKEFPTPSSGDSYAKGTLNRNIDFNKVSTLRRSLTPGPISNDIDTHNFTATEHDDRKTGRTARSGQSMINNYRN
jgi:hypothetical protein